MSDSSTPASDPLADRLHAAREAMRNHAFGEAQTLLQDALALDADAPATHNLLGVLHEVRGEQREAQNSYRKALGLDSKYEPARFNLRQSVQPHGKRSFMLSEMKRDDDASHFDVHLDEHSFD